MMMFTCSFSLWYNNAGFNGCEWLLCGTTRHNNIVMPYFWGITILFGKLFGIGDAFMAGKVNFIPAHRRSERKMPLLGDCYEKNLFAGYCRKRIENAPYIKYLQLGLIRPGCEIFHETEDRALQPSECYGNSKRTNRSSDGFLQDHLSVQRSTLHRWTSALIQPSQAQPWLGNKPFCCFYSILFSFRAVSQNIFLKENTTYYKSHRDLKKYSCRLKFSALPLSVYLMILANSKKMDKIHKQDS